MTTKPVSAPDGSPVPGLVILILACMAGEGLRQGLSLPIPGAALGIAMLFAVFAWRGGVPPILEGASRLLLRQLPLFFVPPGVGIMDQAALVGGHWPAVAAALAGSTVLCLLVTATVLALLNRLFGSPRAAID